MLKKWAVKIVDCSWRVIMKKNRPKKWVGGGGVRHSTEPKFYPWKKKTLPWKFSAFRPWNKKFHPWKFIKYCPWKPWTTRENFQKSGRENEISTREKNRKKSKKGLSRALLIFTGKKKHCRSVIIKNQ